MSAEDAGRAGHRLQFGFCLPLFANPGAAFMRMPAWTELDPPAAVDAAVEAERLGYDSVWVADHLMHGHDGGILEGWTTLCIAAGRTQRVKLGTIHLAQPFRAPSLLAKMAATLDALSGGRLVLFYDCGWTEQETRAYGLPWHDDAERAERMDEALELIDALWRTGAPEAAPLDFDGRFYTTRGAVCRPAPVQRPRPPIWLSEARGDRWLEIVCRHADGWHSAVAGPARMAAKLERLRAACDRHGRDPGSLELAVALQVLIAPTEAEAQAQARRIAQLPPSPRGRPDEALLAFLRSPGDGRLADAADGWLAGSPEAVVEQVRAYTALGVTHFTLWFLDFPSLDGLRLFAEQVIPALREAGA